MLNPDLVEYEAGEIDCWGGGSHYTTLTGYYPILNPLFMTLKEAADCCIEYAPKELAFERKAQERMEAPIETFSEAFTGAEQRPIITNYLEPTKGANYTDEVAQPFFGSLGTDYTDESMMPRDLGI